VRTLSSVPDTERVKSSERWVFANRSPEQSQTRSKTRSGSKSREILSLLGDSGYGSSSVCLEDSNRGVMTRARKRNLVKMSTDSSESSTKKIKVENISRRSKKRSGKNTGKVSSKKSSHSKDGQNVPSSSRPSRAGVEKNTIHYSQWEKELVKTYEESGCCRHSKECGNVGKTGVWCEPDSISYREIVGYPHLNECVNSLEILNIGGSNVLGEFIPFLFLHTPKLKSLGQWLNTMIYGLEILKDLPGYSKYKNLQIQEFSYSSDRNYFCQPYIGFVPESNEFKNVRKEMLRYSNKSAKKIGHKARLHQSKRTQIRDDIDLMVSSCPNLRKVNLVVHYKTSVIESEHSLVWDPLLRLHNLSELDLVTMKFENIKSLLTIVGPRLERLTVECDEEQGNGSEIVHIARHCPDISSLRILLGDKVLRGEMTLHFGQTFFRKLEKLTVEGSVHLHGFAFLWGHCQNLKYIRIGLVVSNELTTTNVLIQDVFTLLFQVNKMLHLEEMHIRNLKVRSLAMATLLLDNLQSLKKASNWFLDLYGEDMATFKRHLKKYKARGLQIDYKEW